MSNTDRRPVDEQTIDRRTVLKSAGAGAAGVALGTGAAGATNPVATTSGLSSISSISTITQTIESWDGTELATTLFLPEGSGPHPSVLMTHGWGSSRGSLLTKPKALNYASNGYAVLTYDSRGFGGSTGTVTLDGPNERKDAQYLITWLANRPEIATEGADDPWIGMDGISYAGGIQFQVAGVDDRLDALVPRITWNDLGYSLAPNGVVKIGWMSALFGLGSFGTLLDGDQDLTDDLSEWYWHAVDENEVPESAHEAFEQRAVSSKEIETPTLLMQGWNDSLFNPSEAIATHEQLQSAGVESRLLFYEGGHDLSEVTVSFDDRGHMNSRALDWMDRHVRGLGSDVPVVENYLPQRDEWRADDEWPPADASMTAYDFGDASVEGSHDIEQAGWWSWGSDTVTYEWTVDEDVEVIGEPELTLMVDVHGPEARLFFEFEHNRDTVNGMDEAYRLPSSGTHTIQLTYPGIQQFVAAGETVGVGVSVSNPWYFDSRTADGVTIHPGGSTLSLPQRPDANGSGGGDDGASDGGGEADGSDDGDDCWLFC